MGVPVYNPSTLEIETGRTEVQGHPSLTREFKASLSYIHLSLKNKINNLSRKPDYDNAEGSPWNQGSFKVWDEELHLVNLPLGIEKGGNLGFSLVEICFVPVFIALIARE